MPGVVNSSGRRRQMVDTIVSRDPFNAHDLGSAVRASSAPYGARGQGASAFSGSSLDNTALFVYIYVDTPFLARGIAVQGKATANFTADQTNQYALYSYAPGPVLTQVAATPDLGTGMTTNNTTQVAEFASPVWLTPGPHFGALVYNNSAVSTHPSWDCVAIAVNAGVQSLDLSGIWMAFTLPSQNSLAASYTDLSTAAATTGFISMAVV